MRGAVFLGVPGVNQAKGCLLWGKRSLIRSTIQGLSPQSCEY